MHSAWELICKDGQILKESDVEFWDNVPRDKEIKIATFTYIGGKRIVFKDFDNICIARIGTSSVDGGSSHVGYTITVVKKDKFIQLTVKKDFIEQCCEKIEKLTIPQHCFRKGIVV